MGGTGQPDPFSRRVRNRALTSQDLTFILRKEGDIHEDLLSALPLVPTLQVRKLSKKVRNNENRNKSPQSSGGKLT